MTEAMNGDDLEHILSAFKDLNSSCEFIWTPLVNARNKGQLQSSVTGRIPSFVLRQVNESVEGDDRNHVGIRVVAKSYLYVPKSRHYCAVCDIYKTAIFSLIGVCEDSYFGNYTVMTKVDFDISN